MFPLTMLLGKGEGLELAPLYLGSLYSRLEEFLNNVVHSLGRYDDVIHADTSFFADVSLREVRSARTKSDRVSCNRDG